MISYIAKLIKALNANENPAQIAHGAACGILLGLMPKDNALWWLLFIVLVFLRINKAAYFLAILLVSALTPLMDPTIDQIGYAVLTAGSMRGAYEFLLDIPFVAFTKFNNTIVMGSLVSGLLLYIPAYLAARILVRLWRKKGVPLLRKSRAIHAVTKIPLVSKIGEALGDEV